MDTKSMIITIVVVAIVVGFITELFYFGGSYTLDFGGSLAAAKNVTGTAAFNGTIRTYDPVVGIPVNTSQAVLGQVRKMPGVKDVRVQAGIILVDTETRDDVYPLALALRQMNLSPVTIVANIAIPPELEVATSNGTVTASTLNTRGVVRLETEPFVDAGSEVPVAMTAVLSEGMLIDYYSARIVAERRSIIANATVVELLNATFTYSIPWEERDIDAGSLAGYSYDYRKVNTIVFSPELNVTSVFMKKALPYVTFIGPASAEVSPDFTNMSAVRGDFAETSVSFPGSTLTVTGKEAPGLAMEPSAVSYAYRLALPQSAEGYALGGVEFVMASPSKLDAGSAVPLNVTLLMIGANVFSVTPAPLS
ncbi:MAG: hypothetical protein PHV13_01815 [Candidatus ainarchaeum sp.]|nr:hypothetical protein [Candidatus ainarchaeum sp.]